MDEEFLSLLLELHRTQYRQGPGSEAATTRAVELAGLSSTTPLTIADIGCGTGASTLQLAKSLNANITAVDFLPAFIDILEQRASNEGLSQQINTLTGSMEKLPFEDQRFDVIWSEGAIYNMGFEKGINAWKEFLKPGGILAVSEITWLTEKRPDTIADYWHAAYPEINTASAKMEQLEKAGYAPLGYFALPEECWEENYYQPLENRYASFLDDHDHSDQAKAIIEADKEEVALYRQYKDYYSYGMYVAKRKD